MLDILSKLVAFPTLMSVESVNFKDLAAEDIVLELYGDFVLKIISAVCHALMTRLWIESQLWV